MKIKIQQRIPKILQGLKFIAIEEWRNITLETTSNIIKNLNLEYASEHHYDEEPSLWLLASLHHFILPNIILVKIISLRNLFSSYLINETKNLKSKLYNLFLYIFSNHIFFFQTRIVANWLGFYIAHWARYPVSIPSCLNFINYEKIFVPICKYIFSNLQ